MATTAVWSIKNKLKTALNYITNPEKTFNSEYGKDDNHHWLHIKQNDFDFKSEKAEFVSAINCSIETAYDEMLITKNQYGKKDGILAFHGYQSFNENEVSPDIAHEIGVKLAEEICGSNFEVVVATHQNTNHIHNHFIINSVSFKDGKKYNNNRSNYAHIRQVSDSLCQEYGLSILEEDKKYKATLEKRIVNDEYYKIVKEDIDTAISESIIMKQFLFKLKQLGYEYYFKYEKIIIWKLNQDKIRVERVFGKDYSTENIKKRFENSRYKQYKNIPAGEIYNNY